MVFGVGFEPDTVMNHVVLKVAVSAHRAIHALKKVKAVAAAFNHGAIVSA
jgi:hypothetical protein